MLAGGGGGEGIGCNKSVSMVFSLITIQYQEKNDRIHKTAKVFLKVSV